MIKKLRYLFTLMLLFVASVGWAEDVVFYTLDPVTGSNNVYANNCDVTIDGITWNVTGNSQQIPWRIGGKNLTGVNRDVYSKTAMTNAVTKVDLEVGTASGVTVNSLKLIVSSDADFSTTIDEVTATFQANSTITFTPSPNKTWVSNAYYKFTFNVTIGNSNKYVQFAKASFYKEKGKEIANVSISEDVLFIGETATVTTDGPTLTLSSSNEDVASINGNNVIGIAEGDAIITATWNENDTYEGGQKTFQVNVKEEKAMVSEDANGVTFNLSENYWKFPTTTTQELKSFTNTGHTIALCGSTGADEGYRFNNSGYLMLGKEGAYLSLPAFDFTVSKITVEGTSSASEQVVQNIYVGETAVSAETTGAKDVINVYEIEEDYQAAGNIYTLKICSAHNTQISKITVYKANGKANPELSFPQASYTVNLGETFTAPTLTTNPEGLTITYASSKETVATVDAATGAVTLVAAGETTITSTFAGNDEYNAGEASYTLTVVDPDAPGTEANPYTVAQARAAIDANTGVTGVYATGIVSEIVEEYSSQFKNISFKFVDENGDDNFLEAYRCKGDEAANVVVGATVVVYGNLIKYGDTYEFSSGCQLVSLTLPAVAIADPVFDPAGGTYTAPVEVSITCATEGATIYYTLDGTDPTSASTLCTSTITISETTTIKAIAYNEDEEASNIVSATYVINIPVVGDDKFELVTDASTLAEGDVIIIVSNVGAGEGYALSTTQNDNNRAAADVTIDDDGTITPSSEVQQITLEDGWYFNVGDGYLYAASSSKNYLRTEVDADDNAKATISIENGNATIQFQGTNTRNLLKFNPNNGSPIFSCYAETSTAGSLPQIYRKVKDVAETVTVEFGAAGYATRYYENKNLKIPEGVTAYTATVDGTSITLNEIKTGYIPAKTAVVLKGTAEQPYDFAVVAEATELTVDNDLQGCETQTTISEEGYKYYVLSTKEGKNPGFYYAVEGGASVNCAANRAYLAVLSSTSTGAKGYPFEDDATGIEGLNVNDNMNANKVYDLQGRRMNVNNMPKGIYIVNGKKVVIK